MSFYDRQFFGLNPRDFGAKGDGVTDDTVAFQACQAEAISSGINAVSFDDGIYIIGTLGTPLANNTWILGDIGVDGFLFEGSGPNAVLRISPTPTAASFAVVGLVSNANPISKRVVIRNFRVDGNRATTGSVGGASITGVRIVDSEDCRIENVIVHSIPGDEGVGATRRAAGISLGGNQLGEIAKRCVVRDCITYDNVGFGLQSLNIAEYGSFENCIAYDNFGEDISISNFANAPDASRAVFFRNCTAVAGPNAVSPRVNEVLRILSNVTDGAQDIQMDGCSLLGTVQVFNTDRAFIDDCIVYGDSQPFLMRLNGGADRLILSNSIVGTNTPGTLIGLESLGGGAPKVDWALRNNILLPLARAIGGTQNVGGDAEVEGNVIVYDGATSSAALVGFRSSDTTSAVRFRRNVLVGDCPAMEFRAAIASSWPSIVISDNYFGVTNALQPATFQVVGAGTYASRPAFYGNILGTGMTRLIVNTHFALFPGAFIFVGGNVETFSDSQLENAPMHKLAIITPGAATAFGRVGDEWTDAAGGAGLVHYVKDSGNVTTSGWVAK